MAGCCTWCDWRRQEYLKAIRDLEDKVKKLEEAIFGDGK